MRTSHIKKTVAMSGAMFIALMGVTASADALAPHASKGHHEKSATQAQGHAKTHEAKAHEAKAHEAKTQPAKSHEAKAQGQGHVTQAQGSTHASSDTHGNGGTHASPGGKGGSGDPAGNNGTVKVDDDLFPGPGPNGHGGGNTDNGVGNDPHVGCTFEVEWYGFDEGADIISKVTFEMQAPTADVTLAPYAPTIPDLVPVGEDAAGGGTDFDQEKQYTLSFTGAPHPKHGYHVKLTINTPGSIGADVKHKVFWVEGCESGGTGGGGELGGELGGENGGENGGQTGGSTPEVAGEQAHQPQSHQQPQSQPEVKGVQATAPSNKAAQAAVPTAVESGLVPVATAVHTAAHQWPLVAGLLGLCLLGVGLLTRRARS